MKRLFYFFPLLALLLAPPLAAQTSTAPPLEMAPVSPNSGAMDLDRFVSLFQSTLAKGCMDAAAKEGFDWKNHCTCYASLFVKRYTPRELFDIVSVGATIPGSSRLMTLMMAPERRACHRPQP